MVLVPVAVPERLRYLFLHNHIEVVLDRALRGRTDVVIARVQVPLHAEAASRMETMASRPCPTVPAVRPRANPALGLATMRVTEKATNALVAPEEASRERELEWKMYLPCTFSSPDPFFRRRSACPPERAEIVQTRTFSPSPAEAH